MLLEGILIGSILTSLSHIAIVNYYNKKQASEEKSLTELVIQQERVNSETRCI